MALLDLPLELFQEILIQCILPPAEVAGSSDVPPQSDLNPEEEHSDSDEERGSDSESVDPRFFSQATWRLIEPGGKCARIHFNHGNNMGGIMSLRLVCKSFASQIDSLLVQLRVLDRCERNIYLLKQYGSIATKYIARRLYSGRELSPILQTLHDTARQIAIEDGGDYDEAFTKYINMFSSIVGGISKNDALLSSQFERSCSIEHVLPAAAALAGNIQLLSECTKNKKNCLPIRGTLGSIFDCAAAGGYLPIVDHLLEKCEEHRLSTADRWWDMLHCASRLGNLEVVQHMVPISPRWESRLTTLGLHPYYYIRIEALYTPSVSIFKHLLQYRKGKDLSHQDYTLLLSRAVSENWIDMARFLLESGGPVESYDWSKMLDCRLVNPSMVELLQSHGVTIGGRDIVGMCTAGWINRARKFMEKGVSVQDQGHLEHLLLLAIRFQHEEFFQFLTRHGAAMRASTANIALKHMKDMRFDGMRELMNTGSTIKEDWAIKSYRPRDRKTWEYMGLTYYDYDTWHWEFGIEDIVLGCAQHFDDENYLPISAARPWYG